MQYDLYSQRIFIFFIGSSMEETPEVNITALDCPKYDEGDDLLLAKFSFWLEGVVQCSVAMSGLVGNAISAFILTRWVVQIKVDGLSCWKKLFWFCPPYNQVMAQIWCIFSQRLDFVWLAVSNHTFDGKYRRENVIYHYHSVVNSWFSGHFDFPAKSSNRILLYTIKNH